MIRVATIGFSCTAAIITGSAIWLYVGIVLYIVEEVIYRL